MHEAVSAEPASPAHVRRMHTPHKRPDLPARAWPPVHAAWVGRGVSRSPAHFTAGSCHAHSKAPRPRAAHTRCAPTAPPLAHGQGCRDPAAWREHKHACTCTCTHVNAHTHAHTCAHRHMYTRGHTHTCTHTFKHARAHACTHTHTLAHDLRRQTWGHSPWQPARAPSFA